jgi:hypothetical protein
LKDEANNKFIEEQNVFDINENKHLNGKQESLQK